MHQAILHGHVGVAWRGGRACPVVTQLCPLGTGTETPEVLASPRTSLVAPSFTMGVRLLSFFPGVVYTGTRHLSDTELKQGTVASSCSGLPRRAMPGGSAPETPTGVQQGRTANPCAMATHEILGLHLDAQR
jgi:hypothetical protein